MGKRILLRGAQGAFLVAVLWFVARTLGGQWNAVRQAYAAAEPRWTLVALSCAVVLVAYALLIETWRLVLVGWGATIPFGTAAQIWWVAGLGKYVPGKVWAVGTMAILAQREGVRVVRATGSSFVVTIVNTLAGFMVLAVVGGRAFRLPPAAVATMASISALLLIAPPLFPRFAAVISRLTRRTLELPPLPRRYILLVAGTSIIAWVMYGFAFQLLAAGITGQPTGASSTYIATFTGSYLSGFLALFAPGGLGVRELVMAEALVAGGHTRGAAWLLAVASRLWLTVLEVAPALIILAAQAARRPRQNA